IPNALRIPDESPGQQAFSGEGWSGPPDLESAPPDLPSGRPDQGVSGSLGWSEARSGCVNPVKADRVCWSSVFPAQKPAARRDGYSAWQPGTGLGRHQAPFLLVNGVRGGCRRNPVTGLQALWHTSVPP